jgi:hypothetical protein
MVHRAPHPAPQSAIPEAQRGPVVGRFCHACGAVFSLHASRHSGKGLYSKDHISSPCSHEGDVFEPGEGWWEPAVAVLPPPPASAEGEGEAAAAG